MLKPESLNVFLEMYLNKHLLTGVKCSIKRLIYELTICFIVRYIQLIDNKSMALDRIYSYFSILNLFLSSSSLLESSLLYHPL